MNTTGVFLKYGGRAILLAMLTIILLRLTGADAAALTQNCGQWTVVRSPNVGSGQNSLYGVTSISLDDVWAVGSLYDQQQASTYHWNGTRWSNISNPSLPFSLLYGVAATSAGDFWAVGAYSPPKSNYRTLIEFYC